MEQRREKIREEEEEEKSKGYGSLVFCMETMILVWIFVHLYEL